VGGWGGPANALGGRERKAAGVKGRDGASKAEGEVRGRAGAGLRGE
jgi:hypothetical protein